MKAYTVVKATKWWNRWSALYWFALCSACCREDVLAAVSSRSSSGQTGTSKSRFCRRSCKKKKHLPSSQILNRFLELRTTTRASVRNTLYVFASRKRIRILPWMFWMLRLKICQHIQLFKYVIVCLCVYMYFILCAFFRLHLTVNLIFSLMRITALLWTEEWFMVSYISHLQGKVHRAYQLSGGQPISISSPSKR